MWEIHRRRFASFLKLEKGLSASSIEGNTRDISKLVRYFELYNINKQPGEITLKDLEGFSRFIGKLNYSTGSQARIISGVKSFFNYCNYDAVIKTMDITAYSLPHISEHSLPAFQSKVYQSGNVRLKLFQSNVYQLIN